MPKTIFLAHAITAEQLYWQATLESSNQQVKTFSCGLEILETLKQDLYPCDLLIVSDTITDIDPLKLVRLLKTDPIHQKIPILLVLTHTLAQSMGDALSTGCDEVIMYPVDPDELAQKLNFLLFKR